MHVDWNKMTCASSTTICLLRANSKRLKRWPFHSKLPIRERFVERFNHSMSTRAPAARTGPCVDFFASCLTVNKATWHGSRVGVRHQWNFKKLVHTVDAHNRLAASLEVLNLVSNYTTRHSLLHQYGRLTTLTNEYLECITKHSPIVPFVQRETWSELENYYGNKRVEAKATAVKTHLDMIRLKELYDFYSEKYRAEANFIFILSMVFIILTMLKMVLSNDSNKIRL